MKPPRPEDYATEEEYLIAMDEYESALYWREEEAIERYYEELERDGNK